MMEVTREQLSAKAIIPPDVMARAVGEEVVILHLTKGAYFGLDEIGARVWYLLAEDRSLQQVCDTLLGEYEVTREDLQKDLLKLVSQLRDQGLLQISQPSASDE